MTRSFTQSSESALANVELGKRLRILSGFAAKRNAAFAELPDGESFRDRAREIKAHTIANLDRYLLELERNVTENGGTVHWARDGHEACAIVLQLALERGVRRVVKSKSMVTEEIELNDALEHAGIEAVETDLGEYIVQIAGEKPSHIIAPAIHKSRQDVADLFAEKLGSIGASKAEELTAVARRELRQKFCGADMGVTGANFLIADTGAIVLVENEGNIRLSTSLPRLHVAVVGIEKVIPAFNDLPTFLKILPRSASGQKFSTYVSIISGPRRDGDADGPKEFHLILLDNGRTQMLADEEKRETLYCLRCGACLNVCPVYQKIGGHAYGSVYPGPIGAIVSPPIFGLKQSKDLPFASTLCGACRDICPVRINIPHILLSVRSDWSERGGASRVERLGFKLWGFAMRRRRLYELGFRVARFFQGPLLEDDKLKRLPLMLSGWTSNRDFPPVAPRAFRELWNEEVRDERP